MVDGKAVGRLAAIVVVALAAGGPGVAIARGQNMSAQERTALRLGEADRLERQGMAAIAAGNHASAVIPLEAALMIREGVHGPDHPDTVRLFNNLGMVFLTIGRPREAESLLTRALASREKALGPDHAELADILHNLAGVYASSEDTSRVEKALPLLERAANIRAQSLGPEHPRVADAIYRMATIDLMLAKRAGSWRVPDLVAGLRGAGPRLSRDAYLDRAQRGLERALAIREKSLGPGHPAVAAGLQSLAAVHVERGHYAQAEILMKQALAIVEKALGPNHPATADVLDAYAHVLANTSHEAEARALKVRARAIRDAQVRRASAAPDDALPPLPR
jgi:tetratricopeptide (TPR) repeat protein